MSVFFWGGIRASKSSSRWSLYVTFIPHPIITLICDQGVLVVDKVKGALIIGSRVTQDVTNFEASKSGKEADGVGKGTSRYQACKAQGKGNSEGNNAQGVPWSPGSWQVFLLRLHGRLSCNLVQGSRVRYHKKCINVFLLSREKYLFSVVG